MTDESVMAAANANAKHIEDKILRLLAVFPKLSPSMIQIGIGSSMPATMWRPVLEDLVSRGQISRDTIIAPSGSGRTQNYTVISLAQ